MCSDEDCLATEPWVNNQRIDCYNFLTNPILEKQSIAQPRDLVPLLDRRGARRAG